jgi:hypothetical protein
MRLIFAFDTEDYVTPEAWDAQRWWPEQLSERGARGAFHCVGELVRRLRSHGRQDVLEALARHEIGYHGNLHSVPPIHCVAVDGLGLADGIAWILRREAAGYASVVEAFGRVPVSFAMNGDSWTPAGFLAMASMGVHVFAGAARALMPARWFCGMLVARYDLAFESYYAEDGGEERFKRDFEQAAAGISEDGALIVSSHPTRLVTAQFWDRPFYRSAEHPVETLAPAPLRPEPQVRAIKDRVRRMLDWMLSRADVRPTDLAGWYAEQPAPRPLASLLAECGLKPGQEGDLPLREPEGADPALLGFFDSFEYGWSVAPEGFSGRRLMGQARRLAWTSAPAPQRP